MIYFERMKKGACIVILLFSAFIALSSFKHPIKLTSSQIKYNDESQHISMECKVFIDDFSLAFNDSMLTRINISNLSETDKKLIENYFAIKYIFSVNGKKLPFEFKTYNVKANVMTITFAIDSITLKKGDQLYIENELLFEEFGDLQSNWVTLTLPPFLANYNFESTLDESTYSYTL